MAAIAKVALDPAQRYGRQTPSSGLLWRGGVLPATRGGHGQTYFSCNIAGRERVNVADRVIVLHVRSLDGHGCAALAASFDEFGGTIGRANDNHLVLPDPRREISRVSANVVCRSAGFFVVAVGRNPISRNGSVLKPGVEYSLRPGDRLQIGGYTLVVHATSDAVSASETDPFADLLPLAQHGPDRTVELASAAPALLPDVASLPAALLPAPAAPVATLEEFLGLVPASASQQPDPFAVTPNRGAPAPAPADAVRLGVAAPREVEPGQAFLVHFCAYPPGDEAHVRESLALQSPRAVALLSKRSCRWPPGTAARVSVTAEDLACDEPAQTLVWNCAAEILDFALRVPVDAPLGERIVSICVGVGPLVIATLRLSVRVTADARSALRVTAYGRAVGSGFASYSARDRELVSHLVGAIEQSAGIDIFWDCLDMRPGEQWKPPLEHEIAKREVFLLFWSRAARGSSWVEWEWRTALREKGLPAIQIHPLQPNVEPPPELAALHVGSLHALIAAYEHGRALEDRG